MVQGMLLLCIQKGNRHEVSEKFEGSNFNYIALARHQPTQLVEPGGAGPWGALPESPDQQISEL